MKLLAGLMAVDHPACSPVVGPLRLAACGWRVCAAGASTAARSCRSWCHLYVQLWNTRRGSPSAGGCNSDILE